MILKVTAKLTGFFIIPDNIDLGQAKSGPPRWEKHFGNTEFSAQIADLKVLFDRLFTCRNQKVTA